MRSLQTRLHVYRLHTRCLTDVFLSDPIICWPLKSAPTAGHSRPQQGYTAGLLTECLAKQGLLVLQKMHLSPPRARIWGMQVPRPRVLFFVTSHQSINYKLMRRAEGLAHADLAGGFPFTSRARNGGVSWRVPRVPAQPPNNQVLLFVVCVEVSTYVHAFQWTVTMRKPHPTDPAGRYVL